MIKVKLATEHLLGGHQGRGVGRYAQLLAKALIDSGQIELVKNASTAQMVHYPYFDFFFPTLPLPWPKKTLVTIHDTIPLIYPAHYPVGKRGRAVLFRQKTYLKLVRAILTDSQSSATDIQSFLAVAANKIHVVHLAADPIFQPQPPAEVNRVRRKYKLPKSYLLYVGDINYNKNLPALIKAVRYLAKTTKLVLVGKNFRPQSIPEWQAIETQIALSDVAPRIKFLTNLAPDNQLDLSAIYSAALVYVQPSLYEGFGLPILEAMQSGCPVVAGNNSSIPEVAGTAAILTQPDATSLAAAINHILQMRLDERKQLVKNSLLQASKFSWQKTAEKTIEVYKQLL